MTSCLDFTSEAGMISCLDFASEAGMTSCLDFASEAGMTVTEQERLRLYKNGNNLFKLSQQS